MPITILALALLLAGPPPKPGFQGVGDLPGGEFSSEALAVSDDGRVVAGRSASAQSGEEGFVWIQASGLRPLLGPGGAHVAGEPRAINPSGSVIAGKIDPLRAARWTASHGWSVLDDLEGGASESQVLGVSADGSVLVGWGASAAGLEAARWVDGRAVAMGDLPGGAFHSGAAQVSADGKTIVGTGTTADGSEVFVWKEATGMVGLGDLPGGDHASEPFGMNPDATVVVGKATSERGLEAMRWTAAGGMKGLGDLPGGDFSSIAFDVSSDGKVVVGTATSASGAAAFVWDAEHGMRSLKDVLLAAGVGAVASWTLTEATGISADGRVVVGNGTNAAGRPEGWVARLP